MKLEFGKYTDITNFAKKTVPGLFNGYEKVYICPDTRNWWLTCLNPNVNEDYEEAPGYYMVERDKIDYPTEKIMDCYLTTKVVKELLEDWGCDCWDSVEAHSLEEAIDVVDGGFGIIPEDA